MNLNAISNIMTKLFPTFCSFWVKLTKNCPYSCPFCHKGRLFAINIVEYWRTWKCDKCEKEVTQTYILGTGYVPVLPLNILDPKIQN